MITHPTKPTAYDTLASENVSWLICQWGSTGSCAVGLRGGHDPVERCLTLFANFDFDDKTKVPPSPPTWLNENLAYLTMTNVRLERTLRLFFHCEVVRNGEGPIEHAERDANPEDENSPIEIVSSYDVVKADRLAAEYARRFIAERIRVSSFVPPAPQVSHVLGFSLGTMVSEPNDRMLEELVEQEAKAS